MICAKLEERGGKLEGQDNMFQSPSGFLSVPQEDCSRFIVENKRRCNICVSRSKSYTMELVWLCDQTEPEVKGGR